MVTVPHSAAHFQIKRQVQPLEDCLVGWATARPDTVAAVAFLRPRFVGLQLADECSWALDGFLEEFDGAVVFAFLLVGDTQALVDTGVVCIERQHAVE